MKKLILFSIVAIFCSCSKSEDYSNRPVVQNTPEVHSDLKIYEIDSCEYIGILMGNNRDVITHKGNCKFCTARNKCK